MVYYGIHSVLESLKSQHLPQVVYIMPKHGNPGLSMIERTAHLHGIPVKKLENLRKLSGTDGHQGVCACIDDFCAKRFEINDKLSDRIVMMDGIQDPHNFGAALRVCEVFGFIDIIFHKGNSCGITSAAIKVSTGAVFHLNLYMSNLNVAVKKLKELNYKIYVLDADGDHVLSKIDSEPKFCLVIGSEYKGVRFSIKRLADKVIKIPVCGNIQSLNVSCALTAALYEFSRGKRPNYVLDEPQG